MLFKTFKALRNIEKIEQIADIFGSKRAMFLALIFCAHFQARKMLAELLEPRKKSRMKTLSSFCPNTISIFHFQFQTPSSFFSLQTQFHPSGKLQKCRT